MLVMACCVVRLSFCLLVFGGVPGLPAPVRVLLFFGRVGFAACARLFPFVCFWVCAVACACARLRSRACVRTCVSACVRVCVSAVSPRTPPGVIQRVGSGREAKASPERELRTTGSGRAATASAPPSPSATLLAMAALIVVYLISRFLKAPTLSHLTTSTCDYRLSNNC